MNDIEMRKTPSALKWLAEKRARVLTDYLMLERLAEDIQGKFERARVELDALDRVVRLFDPELDPSKIGPIKATKGVYGKHGGLKEAILQAVDSQGADWVSTMFVEAYVVMKLQLFFDLPGMQKRWRHNSLKAQLRRLLAEGVLERSDDEDEHDGLTVAHWRRYVQVRPTLRELRAEGLSELAQK